MQKCLSLCWLLAHLITLAGSDQDTHDRGRLTPYGCCTETELTYRKPGLKRILKMSSFLLYTNFKALLSHFFNLKKKSLNHNVIVSNHKRNYEKDDYKATAMYSWQMPGYTNIPWGRGNYMFWSLNCCIVFYSPYSVLHTWERMHRNQGFSAELQTEIKFASVCWQCTQ